MLYDQTGSEKFNMAAFKPEVPISKLVYRQDRNDSPTAIYIYMFTSSSYPIGLTRVYCDLIPESVKLRHGNWKYLSLSLKTK